MAAISLYLAQALNSGASDTAPAAVEAARWIWTEPRAFTLGWPFVLLLLFATLITLYRARVAPGRIAILVLLRTITFGIILILAARPIIEQAGAPNNRKALAILFDRSESMSVIEQNASRYERTLKLFQEQLTAPLAAAGWQVHPFLFADEIAPATGAQLAAAKPDGGATNLGGALTRAMADGAEPPAAVLVLTDGAANVSTQNRTALTALVAADAPVLAVGFGRDHNVDSLTLHNVIAPTSVPPKQEFRVSAALEAAVEGEMPAFEIVLLRDGQMRDTKKIEAFRGSRFWIESFPITENEAGVHDYTVQVIPPGQPPIACPVRQAAATVRITQEKDLRILFVQGALTWDYKFILRALAADPSVHVTGLSRTGKSAIFVQNAESTGELFDGFPTTLEQLADFRVIVLSNLKPNDLSTAQQELIAKFVSLHGGGLFLLGGPETFDSSWQGSRLEQLLPVTFDSAPIVSDLDQPFHFVLTDAAQAHSAFQLAGTRAANHSVWEKLPAFTSYGRIASAKPGATVWAVHETDVGPEGKRILMAAQYYGAGLTTVMAVQNFWRWRLAKDADVAAFDRFWQQFFRYLAQSGRDDVTIEVEDQDLAPDRDIRLILEKQERPELIKTSAPAATTAPALGSPATPPPANTVPAASSGAPSPRAVVAVSDPESKTILTQEADLRPLSPVPITFHSGAAGKYTVNVKEAGTERALAQRVIEIREVNRELQRTSRDMENLRQWSAVTAGAAWTEEEFPGGNAFLERLRTQIDQAARTHRKREPWGLNPYILGLLIAALAGEWILRKKWGLP